MNILKKIRQWFIWFGGWEDTRTNKISIRISVGNRFLWKSPYPIAFFGYRFIIMTKQVAVVSKGRWYGLTDDGYRWRLWKRASIDDDVITIWKGKRK